MRAILYVVMLAWGVVGIPCAWAQDQPATAVPAPDNTPVLAPAPVTEGPIPPAPQLTVPVPEQAIPGPIKPSEPPTDYTTPPTAPPIPVLPENFINVSGDSVRTQLEEGQAVLTVAQGNVRAHYRNIIITANSGQVDYRTNIATFQGNVVFRIDSQEVYGNQISLNLESGEWTNETASTMITPEYAKGYLRAPVFARARTIQGYRRRWIILQGAEVTTCNLPVPHYDLVARTVQIFPGSRIILRNVTFYALGHRIFSLPRLVFPLRQIQRRTNLIPNVGQTQEEGFYLKTSYAYQATQTQSGLLNLDLMSNKGFGQGIRQDYTLGNGTGELRLYHLFDQNINEQTFTGHLNHGQQFGTVKFNLTSDLRSNSYLYAPQSTSLTNQATFTRNRGTANTSLVLSENMNDVFLRTSNMNGILRHTQLFGKDTVWDTNFDYTSYNGVTDTARLNSKTSFAVREDKFDWTLSAQQLTDLSDEAFVGGGGFGGINTLPEVALASDTTRLGRVLPFGLPAQLKFSVGNYAELPTSDYIGRSFFEIDTPVNRRQIGGGWALSGGAGFRQYVYSDDTAQYSVDTSAQLRKDIAPDSSVTLTYRFQRPQGFTPFRFDYVPNYNIINGALNIKEGQRFKLSLLSGYNFQQKQYPWQDATLRFSVQPTNSLMLYTSTGYDFNNSRWRNLINQVRIRSSKDFKLDIGTNYNTTQSKLATARAQLDTKVGSKNRVQAVAGYNGFTGKFDYRSFRITRDLHCWELSVIYTNQSGFYEDQGIRINLRIKALPLFEDFGVGAFGQALDTSVGEVY
ncbi:MAG: hypothetical protein ABFD54_02270 [Armatimonadota bacterium]|nr:hypothetical protein [bacterium]